MEVVRWIIGALVILSGLVVLVLMGYPSRFSPWASDQSEDERAVSIETDRRHHWWVDRLMSAFISIIAGVLAVMVLADADTSLASGLMMASISMASAAVFVLLIRKDRRRSRRSRGGGTGGSGR